MSPAPVPHIATYQLRSSQQRAPQWLAIFVDLGVRLPPAFEGDTEAEAYGAACEFWESEQRAIARARVARGEAA